jgi:hypothetical protein
LRKITPRAIWELVGRLDLSLYYAAIASVEGRAGREHTDPQVLISLWLYAYSRGISSAREVARQWEYEPAFQWLCALEPVSHRTLSGFRSDHQAVIRLFRDPHFSRRLHCRLAVGNFHFNLPQQIYNLLWLVPLVWHDRSSSSGKFSLISPGTENPGQVTPNKSRGLWGNGAGNGGCGDRRGFSRGRWSNRSVAFVPHGASRHTR